VLLGDHGHELPLFDPADLEEVRDQISAVQHLTREGFFDLADRGDTALDEAGAQGHSRAKVASRAHPTLSNTRRNAAL